jgi:hypothetical protein
VKRYGTPKAIGERLVDALRLSRPKFLISGEGLCRISESGLRKLLWLLEEQSSDIIVVVYVREPTSLVHSLAQQLTGCFRGPPFRLSSADVEAIIEANRQDIEWLSGVLGRDLLASAARTDQQMPVNGGQAEQANSRPSDEDFGRLIFSLLVEISTLRGSIMKAGVSEKREMASPP